MAFVQVGKVSFSGPHQGLLAHIERYRNSPVMHKKLGLKQNVGNRWQGGSKSLEEMPWCILDRLRARAWKRFFLKTTEKCELISISTSEIPYIYNHIYNNHQLQYLRLITLPHYSPLCCICLQCIEWIFVRIDHWVQPCQNCWVGHSFLTILTCDKYLKCWLVPFRSVPDEYKPMIFASGEPQPFPSATRKIKRPAPAKRRWGRMIWHELKWQHVAIWNVTCRFEFLGWFLRTIQVPSKHPISEAHELRTWHTMADLRTRSSQTEGPWE